MSVDIFGKGPRGVEGPRGYRGPPGPPGPPGLPGIGFYLDDEGNFDIENKKLVNVANPEEENDVTTKIYIDNLITRKVNDISSSFKNINKTLTQLKSEDDHIKNFVGAMKAQLFDLHNNVLKKDDFESALKTINEQISMLNKNDNAQVGNKICAYETIIFQTNSKLESGKFPFVLGMKGISSKKTGYVMPYEGFIDTITLTSHDIDQHISVKLIINGNEFKDLDINKFADTYSTFNRIKNIHLNEGDIINFQAASDTINEKSMHIIQLFLKYNLGNLNDNSEDIINNVLGNEPINDEEIEFNEKEYKDDKNIYELTPSSDIEGKMKNIIISDDFGNVVYSSDNTDPEIKRKYGDNIL